MSVSGKWEGKLIDASGVTGIMEVHLKYSRGRVSGDFSAYFLSDADGCCADTKRLVQTGPVTGSYNAKTKKVRLTYKLSVGLKPIVVSVAGDVGSAGDHAKRALRGCFAIKGDSALSLDGGAVVLWQYAGSRRRG